MQIIGHGIFADLNQGSVPTRLLVMRVFDGWESSVFLMDGETKQGRVRVWGPNKYSDKFEAMTVVEEAGRAHCGDHKTALDWKDSPN